MAEANYPESKLAPSPWTLDFLSKGGLRFRPFTNPNHPNKAKKRQRKLQKIARRKNRR